MAVLKKALTTLVSAKRALGVPTADTSTDTLIEEMIDAATEWIESQCNRKFVRRDYNDGSGTHGTTTVPDESRLRISGTNQKSIVLPNFPVVDDSNFVLEVLASRASDGTATWSTTGLQKGYNFELDAEKGIIRALDFVFDEGVMNYRITYEAGYLLPVTTPVAPYVPEDLTRCCNEIVRNMFQGEKGLVTSEKIGTWTRSYDRSRDNPLIEPVIEKYKADSNLIV